MIKNDEGYNNLITQLSIPSKTLNLRRRHGSIEVFDALRKKYVAFTPEENVRQHFINYMISDLGYPSSLMQNEVGIELYGTHKRCDTIVFSNTGMPLVIVEYKAPNVKLSQTTFNQIIRYNYVLKAPYMIVTNGKCVYCCFINYKNGSISFLPSVPSYKEILLSD